MKNSPEEIEVLISNPWVNDYVPLPTWLQMGPGSVRPLTGVIAVRERGTKKKLPISLVPLAYRNTRWSRWLIRMGWLKPPKWPRQETGEAHS